MTVSEHLGLRSPHLLAVVTATLGLLAFVAAPSSQATYKGRNGLIVYSVELQPGHYQLFTIRPDGSGRTQVTHGAGAALNADWSPDGRSLVFELGGVDTAGIAVSAANGAHPRILTPTGFQGQPSFSPDGRWIVYERDVAQDDNGVWLIRSDGTQNHRVTRSPKPRGCCDTDPNFSPDGKWITFVRVKKDHELQALFAVRPDGTGLHRLTPFSWEVSIKHDWSPDGTTIVLTDNADFARPRDSANIVAIKPDGTGRKALTTFTGGKENGFVGSFSPDGKEIVFRLERGDAYALAVIDRDGGNMRLITKLGPTKPRLVDWGTHP